MSTVGQLGGRTRFTYGIASARTPTVPHREHMTEEEARRWLQEWVDDDGKPGVFVMIRRPIGSWEVVPDA